VQPDLFGDVPPEECRHPRDVLLRLDCGAGGTQYRRYCLVCWRAIGGAIPHALARSLERGQGFEAPLAELEQLRRARAQARR
jgi:hypothetical protein